MSITCFRPNQHVYTIPGYGQRIIEAESSVAAAAGWWEVSGKTCVAAYQPKGAASYAASLSNLANPGTYDAAEGVAPTWATGTGWTFNGSTQWLTSGITPGAPQGWSLILAYTGRADGGWASLTGIDGGAGYGLILAEWSSGIPYFYNGGSAYGSNGDLPAAGVIAVANDGGFIDGTQELTIASATVNYSTNTVVIGGIGAGGSANSFKAFTCVAWAIYSDALTDGEVATLTTAMAAL